MKDPSPLNILHIITWRYEQSAWRVENLVSARVVVAVQRLFEDEYIAGLPADTDVVILDIDSTSDEKLVGRR